MKRWKLEEIVKRWKRSARSQTGMSLVEATIILMVLSILTAVFAPSMQSFVDDAKLTKAKEDCEVIGISIVRLLKETGSPFLLVQGNVAIATRYQQANRVDLTFGDGVTPAFGGTTQAATTNTGNINTPANADWLAALGANTDTLYRQLVSNEADYVDPVAATPGFGWRGAYLSPKVGPDPWGQRYTVNSVYLGTGTDSTVVGQGHTGTGWSFDSMCVSAGPNAQIEANFEDVDTGTVFTGTGAYDDIIYVISGFGK